jgi:hypothetical protein
VRPLTTFSNEASVPGCPGTPVLEGSSCWLLFPFLTNTLKGLLRPSPLSTFSTLPVMHRRPCTPPCSLPLQTPFRTPSIPIAHRNSSFLSQRQKPLTSWARISKAGTIPRQGSPDPQIKEDDSETIDVVRHLLAHINRTPLLIGMVINLFLLESVACAAHGVRLAIVAPSPTILLH